MQITRLQAHNFMALGAVELPDLHTMGLTLLQGLNEDDASANSNGAGKSSIVDAISWCLYGETARGESGDAIVNQTVGKNCYVQLTVQDGADCYVITRYRKHKTHKNDLRVGKADAAAGTIDLTKGTTDLTQDVINKILGCTPEVFNAAIYAGQDKMPDLPGMTDKALKIIVEQAAGVDRLQRAYEIARAKVQEAKSSALAASSSLERLNAQVTGYQNNLMMLAKSANDWQTQHKLRIYEAEKAAEGEALLLKRLAEDEARFVSALALHEGERAVIRARLAGLDSERAELDRLQGLESAARSALSAAHTQRSQMKQRAELAKHNLDTIISRIGTPCGECGKPMDAEHAEEHKVRATHKLKVELQNLRTANDAVTTADTEHTRALERVKAHRAVMTDASAEIAAERTASAQIETIQLSLRTTREHAKQAQATIDRVPVIKAEKNPHIEHVRRVKAGLDDCLGKAKTLKVTVDQLQEAVALAQDAADVFSPTGVRGHILDTVTPYLNDRTGHYLGVLSDGNIRATWTTITATAKGEAREKFSIQVENKTGAKSFGGLSGGEKRKVRLATAMALQDLVASRATKPISMFIADEIDHALDAAGLERLMTLLEEKAREKGTVMVVSHNSLRDWIRNVVTVTKKGGVSTVTVE